MTKPTDLQAQLLTSMALKVSNSDSDSVAELRTLVSENIKSIQKEIELLNKEMTTLKKEINSLKKFRDNLGRKVVELQEIRTSENK